MTTRLAEDGDDQLVAVARGGVLNLVTGVVGAVLALAMIVVVGRSLGPSGAGVFFEAVALFSILAAALELGAQAGLIRTVTSFRERDAMHELRRLITVALIPVLLLGVVAAILAYLLIDPVAAALFSEQDRAEAAKYLRVLAPFLPLAAGASVALGCTRAFGSMVPFVLIRNLGKPILRPLLTVAAIAAGLGPTAIALSWALPAGLEFPVAFVALALLLRRPVGDATGRPVRRVREIAREFWFFAAPRGLASLFQMAVLWLDIILVGVLASTREAGIYAVASRLILIGTLAIEAVRLAIAPQIGTAIARNDLRGAQRLYQLGTCWLMTPSWPLYLTMAAFAPVFLRLFGDGFVEAQTALTILCLAMLVNIGTGNVTVVLLMAGKTSWNLQNAAVSVVLNVSLNLLLIPRMGITGAAVAWAITILWDNLVPLVRIHRLLGLHPFGSGYWAVAAAALVTFGAIGVLIRIVFGEGFVQVTAAVVLSGAAYVLLLWRRRGVLRLSLVREALRPKSKAARDNLTDGRRPAEARA